MPRKVDVLLLVEHVARELDVATLLKYYLERDGLTAEIRHLYFDVTKTIQTLRPTVVATPFFYRSDELGLKEYVRAYPRAIFFNLAWEEVFYRGHTQLKKPSGDFALQKVIHHAWGRFFAEYLLASGVPANHIFINGNPAYQLYAPKYRRYFSDRSTLARQHNLDPKKRWLLIPENYNWAFINYGTMLWRVGRGGKLSEMVAMRRYARACLVELLGWAAQVSGPDWEVIIRPKPATQLSEMTRLAKRLNLSGSVRIIKDGSVREWILAADVVASSFSTTLIEAALADKPIIMVEPKPLIEAFQADWYRYLPKATSTAAFIKAVATARPASGQRLKRWATATMLAQTDCLVELARYLKKLAR